MSDPHLITKLIVGIYVTNCVYYTCHGLYGNAWYWFAAAQITIVSTWVINR